MALAAVGSVSVGGQAADPSSLFGTAEVRIEAPAGLPQWQRMRERMAEEEPLLRACAADPAACPDQGVATWLALLRRLESAPRAEQVRTVNAFVNRWRYRTDPENWGARDHWATPLEFILRSGDCEDYAIVKYHSLRRLGFAPEELRLVVVQDTQREIAHAVLAVRLDDEILVLDNLTDTVRSQRSIRHYAPYYSINETARWVHVGDRAATVPAARAPSPARSPGEPPR